MGHLEGKVAVVTGASKGIGAGIAERLAGDGARVVVNYARSADAAKALIGRIEGAGGTAVAVQADISKPEEIKRLFDEVRQQFGQVDILVNNAGIYAFGGLDDVTAESFDRHFNLNVKGLLLATQAAVRLFPKTGGVVVNISSGVAKTPIAEAHVYSATKGAVDVLTRGLALELGPRNIRVVGIAPGLTQTEGVAEMGMDPAAGDAFLKRTPLGRFGLPKDIAGAVAFAVSDDGGWITGETIQTGGGLML